MAYKTPGVYVEEIALLPPSVAQVETAIPAFIGYTEKALDEYRKPVTNLPYVRRIGSLADYERYFGKAQPQRMKVTIQNDLPSGAVIGDNETLVSKYRMYYALQLFYANGGGPCYIICVGRYTAPDGETVDKGALIDDGLAALKKKDEPTLVLFPDAVGIDGGANAEGHYYEVLQAALEQCDALGDRFLICDLFEGDVIGYDAVKNGFRTGIGNDFLKYGAAYHPWLRTTFRYDYEEKTISFDTTDDPGSNQVMNGLNLADVKARVTAEDQRSRVLKAQELTDNATDAATAIAAARKAALAAIVGAQAIVEAPNSQAAGAGDALAAAQGVLAAVDIIDPAGQNPIDEAKAQAQLAFSAVEAAIAASFIPDVTDVQKVFTNEFEEKLKEILSEPTVVMPPGSAVAGVYARVDGARGVWKAPANVSLNAVIEPMVKISNEEQDWMNIDPTGKSINAIRAFAGKGIMVWGARTLTGNDNEWRYVSTRRFFNMAEESIKKATEQFVFEPNDANTWVKVRAMIENYLTTLWRQGALAGAKTEDAFYVQVGLGQTMTALDILEGRMIVEIGMAVVRPAEFIILKFTHKMQES